MFVAPKEPPIMNPPSQVGLACLEVARHELAIGAGEELANNAGRHVARYKSRLLLLPGEPIDFTPKEDLGAWCASFCSYSLARVCGSHAEAAKLLGVSLDEWHHNRHGAKALYKMIRVAGFAVADPQPGDVFCLQRGRAGDWRGHIGWINELNAGGFLSLEGNKGLPPALAKSLEHKLNEPGLLGYARLPLQLPQLA